MEYTFKNIEYNLVPPLAIISLNRPAVRNAVSLSMTTELDRAFTLAARDHSVRVIVLRANGAHFSSGHDLGSDAQLADQDQRNFYPGPLGDVEKWLYCLPLACFLLASLCLSLASRLPLFCLSLGSLLLPNLSLKLHALREVGLFQFHTTTNITTFSF
jgi:hypothetical protein